MSRKLYLTDLADQQWQLTASLTPLAKVGGRPHIVDVREILNAIFYILTSGCAWRLLPHDLQFTITFDVGVSKVCGNR